MTEPKNPTEFNVEIPSLDPESEGEDLLRLFDPDNPDIALFNLVDDEFIKLSGSKLLYYKYQRNLDSQDDVYMEDRNKAVEFEPTVVFGHYDPTVIEQGLEQFGIVAMNDQLFSFNRNYVQRVIGRAPIEGDIIVPQFQNIAFRVAEVQEDEFQVYGVYHYTVTAKVLRDSKILQRLNITTTTEPIGRSEVDTDGQ